MCPLEFVENENFDARASKFWNWTSKIIPDLWLLAHSALLYKCTYHRKITTREALPCTVRRCRWSIPDSLFNKESLMYIPLACNPAVQSFCLMKCTTSVNEIRHPWPLYIYLLFDLYDVFALYCIYIQYTVLHNHVYV